MAKTQEELEEEARNKKLGVASSVLGFGAPIAGMIPSLLAGPQRRQLEQYQRGEGAGAAVARQTGSEAARRVLGASTAQPSSGRGGALREGLRAADQLTQRGAEQAAVTGMREGLAATQMLRQNEMMRRQSAARLGTGLGMGLAGIGATLASASDQGPVEAAAPEAAQAGTAGALQRGAAAVQDPVTGLGAQPTEQQSIIDAGQQGLSGLSAARQQALPAGPPQAPGPLAISSALTGPSAAEAQAAQHLEGLVQVTEGKQYAQQVRRSALDVGGPGSGLSVTTPSENPPSMEDPTNLEAWIYQQAWNYDPRIGQGIEPSKAAELLVSFGFTPDAVALGLMGASPESATMSGGSQ